MSGRRGSTTTSFTPRFTACLKNVAATGWFAVGFEPGEQDQVGVLGVAEDVRDRPGADPFEQRRDAGGVAEPGAVIDVVRAQRGPHQLLEEIGLLVAALGGAEPGEGPRSVFRLDGEQAATRSRSSASSHVASRNAGITWA